MFEQFFVLFMLIGFGVLAGRLGGIDTIRNEGVGKLLLQVATPALLFTSTLSLDMQGGVLMEFIIMSALCFGWFFLFTILALVFTRLSKTPQHLRSMVIVSLASSNNGFMGFPIAIAFFGEKGLLLMVAHNLVMNILLFTVGIYLFRGSADEKQKRRAIDIAQQMFNLNITAVFLGIGLSLAGGAHWIEGPVMTVLGMLAASAIPLSMMYIGITLSASHPVALLRDGMTVQASLIRLTAFPVITFLLCLLLPMPPEMKQILFVTAMLPTAASVPVLTGIYAKTTTQKATRIVLFSTVLSLITAPLGVWIATAVFS